MIGTLLRSETTQSPEERLLYTEERTESRGVNTRIWENVYEVPVLDADGEPTGATETKRRHYYEKATNLCYRENDEGPWLPSEPVFENSTLNPGGFAVTRAPIRVELAAGIGDGAHLVCTEDGHSTRFSLRGLGYYERTTGQLVILAEPESVSPIKVADDLIRYPGVFPGCDIDYYYDLTGVQQRVRLAFYAMGAPQSYGLDPANTLLVAVSDLSFDEDGVTARVEGQERQTIYEGDDIPIDFSRDEKRLFTLANGRAWDEGGSYWTGHPVYKHLTTEQGGAQLIEGVPYTWLTNGEREYPVTVDYIIRTGSAGGSEVWRSGNTYYVSGGGYFLGSGDTLVIEPGTVVKIGANSAVGGNQYGNLRVQGEKFDFIVVTSVNHNGVGETIAGISTGSPSAGDYPVAFFNSASDPLYRYLKIAYAGIGIFENGDGSAAIEDCIFYQCQTGIYAFGTGNVTIHNCLLNDCADSGVLITDVGGDVSVTVQNCTFHRAANAIDQAGIRFADVQNGDFDAHVLFRDNLFTSEPPPAPTPEATYYAIRDDGWSGTVNPTVSHQAYHGAAVTFDYGTAPTPIPITPYPYDTTNRANGSFYLAVTTPAHPCRDGGSRTASAAGLDEKTVDAPEEHTTPVGTTTWSKVSTDSGTVDIGYHHDRVDHMIGDERTDSNVQVTGTLTISNGIVVAYSAVSAKQARISVTNTGSGVVVFPTDSEQPALFTSSNATSARISAPNPGADFNYALQFSTTPTPDSVKNAIVRYGKSGIHVLNPSDLVLENCVFDRCGTGLGLHLNNDGNPVVQNCLFSRCTDDGLRVTGGDAGEWSDDAYVRYCTFDRLPVAVSSNEIGNTGQSASATVLLDHNVLTNISEHIFSRASGEFDLAIWADNNLYWRYGSLAATGVTVISNTNSIEDNPLFVHDASMYRAGDEVPDGYYLSQNSNDVSMRPLVGTDVTDLSPSIANLSSGDEILVVGFEHMAEVETKFSYTHPGSTTDGEETKAADLLLVITVNGSSITLVSGDYVTVEFSDGDAAQVYLPDGTYTVGSGDLILPLWIAQDGSTFWARRTKTDFTSASPDQDAVFSMRFDADGPACSVNPSGSNRSPAVDQGDPSPASSTGTTSTDGASDSSPLDLGYHYDGSVIP